MQHATSASLHHPDLLPVKCYTNRKMFVWVGNCDGTYARFVSFVFRSSMSQPCSHLRSAKHIKLPSPSLSPPRRIDRTSVKHGSFHGQLHSKVILWRRLEREHQLARRARRDWSRMTISFHQRSAATIYHVSNALVFLVCQRCRAPASGSLQLLSRSRVIYVQSKFPRAALCSQFRRQTPLLIRRAKKAPCSWCSAKLLSK